MSPEESLILVLFIALLNAVTAIIVSFTHKDIKALEVNTNSKMDELLRVTKELARTQGIEEGREKQKKEDNGHS